MTDAAEASRRARAVVNEMLQARPALVAAADEAWTGPHHEAFRERHQRITAQAFVTLERLIQAE